MHKITLISSVKKSIITLILFVCVATNFPTTSFAVEGVVPANNQSQGSSQIFTLKNPLKVDSIGGLVQNFVEIFSYIVILFAVLALVYVGLKFILARGNVDEMKKLKDWLLWIVVGVAVVIGARVIVQVVISTLSASGTIDQGVINSTRDALDPR
jgi:prepilin signal peptidase PulO-like enzyme (type II secretory pathway)